MEIQSIADRKLNEIKEAFLEVGGVIKFLMAITAVFTGQAAYVLFSPETGFEKILTFVPALVMIGLAEGMFILASGFLNKAQNAVQRFLAGGSLLLALLTIILTDAATAVFLAQRSGYLSIYDTVPTWAQMIATYVMPVMAITHGVILALYDALDETRILERNAKRELVKAKHEATKAYYEGLAAQYRTNLSAATERGRAQGDTEFATDLQKIGANGHKPQVEPVNFTNQQQP